MASVAEAQQSTQNALEAAVAARRFPEDALGFASKLLTRLEAPTRVTLLGMPKSGKTSIFNLLAGREIVPEGLASTVQLVHGENEKATATLRDGTKMTLEGTLDMQRIGSLTPAFVKLEMDLPALRKISLLEVVTAQDRGEQIRAIKWAMKQTDIAIWCSDEYNTAEQALWENAPDALKDHAILVRAKADELGKKRDAMMQYLTREAGSDFAYFLPVSALQAKAARANPEAVDKAQLKESGAMALISTILRQIEQGRQYAVDQAEILLHKHRDAVSAPAPAIEPAPAAEPAPEPKPEPVPAPVPEAKVVEAEPVAQEAVAEAAVEVEAPAEAPVAIRVNAAKPKKPVVAAEPPAAAAEVATESLNDAEREAFATAVERLQETGSALSGKDEDPKVVIKTSTKTLDWLSEYLYEDRWPDTDNFETFRDMTQGASDLMQLLKIEGDDNSAVDAVSAMLQLKRGFQARLAA